MLAGRKTWERRERSAVAVATVGGGARSESPDQEVPRVDTKITNVVAELKAEEQRARERLAELKKEEQQLQKEIRRIQAGISGLEGKSRTSKRSPAKKTSKQQQMTSRGLEDAIEAILRVDGAVSEDDLFSKVKAQVEAKRKSTAGLRQAIETTLTHSRKFSLSPTGWRLQQITLPARELESDHA